jgi:cytochrome bd-type quinol oxidase subunit 2
MVGRAVRRVVAPTLVWAVLTSAVAVAVNLATEWKSNPWAWLAVVVTTVLVAVAALWVEHRHGDPSAGSERPVHGQVVTNSTIHGSNFQVGGDVSINRDREG